MTTQFEIPSIDQYWMTEVYLISTRSKDERTHVGALIINDDNVRVASGYNSFVRCTNDDLPERQERPEKYFWIEHAERNSIYGSARVGGVALKGTIMYTSGMPCSDCARAICQVGIKEVVLHKQWADFQQRANAEKWIESAKRSIKMFEESGVTYRYYDGPLAPVYGLCDGKIMDNLY